MPICRGESRAVASTELAVHRAPGCCYSLSARRRQHSFGGDSGDWYQILLPVAQPTSILLECDVAWATAGTVGFRGTSHQNRESVPTGNATMPVRSYIVPLPRFPRYPRSIRSITTTDLFCHRFRSDGGGGLGNAAVAVPVYTKGRTVVITFDTILFALAEARYITK
jgi:hypothetical protein